MGVGESPALAAGWLNSGRGSWAPKKRKTALRCFVMREVKRAALL